MSYLKLEKAWVDFPIRKNSHNETFAALKDINLDLKSGDRLGIMGKNGSGKTTLLRVLAGIYPPTRGRFQSEGSIGSMLSIGAGTNGKVSGRNNILFQSKLLGRSKEIALATVEDAIEFGELGEFIDQPVETYSSGMKMKLTFSVATAVHPEILIMDEWLSVGDENFRNKAKTRINSLVDQAEILVIASHSKGLLKSTCNQFIRLDQGEMTRLENLD